MSFFTLFKQSEVVEVFGVSPGNFVVEKGCLTLSTNPPIPALPDRNLDHVPNTTVNGDTAVGLSPPRHRPRYAHAIWPGLLNTRPVYL